MNSTYLGEQDITPLCWVNQSISKITSRPSEGSKVRLAENGCPSIRMLTPGHFFVHLMLPRGELVTIASYRGVTGTRRTHANLVET